MLPETLECTQRIGQAIRLLRQIQGLPQAWVEKDAEIPRGSLSAIEGGKRKVDGILERRLSSVLGPAVHDCISFERRRMRSLLLNS